MLKGFKEFIMKGNVIDLAVAVIIGGAFGTLIKALVNSVLMPLISMLVGSPKFDEFLVFGQVRFGEFLTALVSFLLIAASVYFVVVLPMNKMIEHRNRRLGSAEEEEPVDPQIALLTEIRDSLQTRL